MRGAVLLVGSQLLGLHLELGFERSIGIHVDGLGALVELGIAERAVLFPDKAVDFLLVVRDEIAFFLIEHESEQAVEGVFAVDGLSLEHAHGDLEDGPFASIATKLEETLKTRFELERYGAPGDDFDPALHDALMATTSPDVDHPVIGQVLTSGYRRGERVVRAAKVLVNNPE